MATNAVGMRWLEAQETKRANLAREAETHRSNVANETEAHRHNTNTERYTETHYRNQDTVASNKQKAEAAHWDRQDTVAEKRQDAEATHWSNQDTVAQQQADTARDRQVMDMIDMTVRRDLEADRIATQGATPAHVTTYLSRAEAQRGSDYYTGVAKNDKLGFTIPSSIVDSIFGKYLKLSAGGK